MTRVTEVLTFQRPPSTSLLKKAGIRLQQYYVQRVCSPTRSAVIAGHYPHHMGLARKVIADGKHGMPLNDCACCKMGSSGIILNQ